MFQLISQQTTHSYKYVYFWFWKEKKIIFEKFVSMIPT